MVANELQVRVRYGIRRGSRFPAGATVLRDGVNFSIFSRAATHVELLLYETSTSAEPFQEIALAADEHRSFYFWHVFVEGLKPGVCYAWRVDGPRDEERTGYNFEPRLALVDPWARAIDDGRWDRGATIGRAARHASMRGIVTQLPPRPRALHIPGALTEAIVYELHVGGFTRHPSSGVAHPGTFAGLIEKIPYLRELGVTHVELMPAMAFDEQDVPSVVAARGLRNYWGYSTHSFYSPHPRYCVEPARAAHEFRELADALHAAGIGVLMDVVFNHTSEGGTDGPIMNFKGLANDVFYHLDAADRRRYRDYTGCGNTVNCSHPLVTAFIVHCLEYWVEELGVDGFRFDLASVFARDMNGMPMADPPVPWALESSPTLARVPLIAEAWDAAGLYQVGSFPGMGWMEWNGRYRDIMRRFVRGDPGIVGEVATRLAGSADLYRGGGRLPGNSVNFVTCHDGFTLHDLVSYNGKHNESNGEDNRDGSNDNSSWNCGMEGETADPAVNALRRRQAKNLLSLLMLSRGVPMLLAGDEVLRTQLGNNNAWCQDSDLSWFDWRLLDANSDFLRFTRELMAFRKRHPCLTANRFFDGSSGRGGLPDVSWRGPGLDEPNWQDPGGRFLAMLLGGLSEGEEHLYVLLNMAPESIDAAVPTITNCHWHVAIDTASESPQDIAVPPSQRRHAGSEYRVQGRSVVVLEGRRSH
jgi:isoamylase